MGLVLILIFTQAQRRKMPSLLSFKVATGKVVRGWDEALPAMNKGEKVQMETQSEWTSGKPGQPNASFPPNAELIFEVELVGIG